ncbi:DUF924 family protein [Psychrobacter sp. FDAARGOS_221]|uniref:DUF924 family protein n=1 Tax=Psychrobacter sp. FDAARGOS_221 TaxID=1975705 RepID=UPI000BB58184|nr:DUF924 family protein [Psychrobacter sp. FDAARGOS_221]PNK61824.1 DUF924 domain-containing protein [Psychrobacter sp. FDAARGOS_221]
MQAQQVLDFWFNDAHQPYWFAKDDEFDAKIRELFEDTLQQAKAGECAHWRETAQGAVAEIIVLDQFSRNLYRNSPQAFAQDGMALILAQQLLKRDDYQQLTEEQKRFGLIPFMHSESKKIHAQALTLFEELGDAVSLEFEIKHKYIIDRFGRYPHRNEVLGRDSTAEEIEFLKQPDSSF